jgi:hypothetical protein
MILRTAFLVQWKLINNYLVQVSAESASQFGELVADAETKELLHYAEKPETFVRRPFFISCFLCIWK